MYCASLGVRMDNVENFKNKVEREMRSGFIALLSLYVIDDSAEPIYGYKIIQKLNDATKGKLKFQEGTVYPILRYLQKQKFMTSYLGESPKGAPRKYYKITDQGTAALQEGLKSWQNLRDILSGIFQSLEVK
jgi:DNA-binding PadR family transcriptional regulator